MKRLPIPNTVLEVGYITTAAIVGIIVLGRVTQTNAYAKAEGVALIGPILTGIKSAAFQVFNP